MALREKASTGNEFKVRAEHEPETQRGKALQKAGVTREVGNIQVL